MSLIDLANVVAVSLLVSQVIFRLVSYGWSVSHLKDRRFQGQTIIILLLTLITILTFLFRGAIQNPLIVKAILINISLVICLYVEIIYRAQNNLAIANIYLCKFPILFVFVPDLLITIANLTLGFFTLYLFFYCRRDSDHSTIDRATRSKFWLSSNLNYALQNSDQIVALIFFSSQFYLFSIFIRLFKFLDPLLNSYNQILAIDYAQDSGINSSKKRMFKQSLVNATLSLVNACVFLIVGPLFYDFDALYVPLICFISAYVTIKVTSGAHHLLNYHGYENTMLRIEAANFIAIISVVGVGFFAGVNPLIVTGLLAAIFVVRMLAVFLKIRQCTA